MPSERYLPGFEIVPFRDLPFKELTPEERKAVSPIAEEAKAIALLLLSDKVDAAFPNGIYVMGSYFAKATGYEGADVLVEKFRYEPDSPDPVDRDFSIAFYPEKVINRPNFHGITIIKNEDGTETREDGVNEMYEVGAEELQQVLADLRECIGVPPEPQSALSLDIQGDFQGQPK